MDPHIILSGVVRVAVAPIAGVPSKTVFHNPSSSLSANTQPRAHTQAIARRVADYFGDGFIAGIITIESVLARRRVRLTDALTGYVVAELWSASNGSYRFESINANREYVVLSHDHERQFNAVVADYDKPERRP